MLCNGEILACAQEERFSREKFDSRFPLAAIKFCVEKARLELKDLDAVAFFEKPYSKFHRSLVSQIKGFPFSYVSFLGQTKSWLSDRLNVNLTIQESLRIDLNPYFVPHHLAHAASCCYVSPFEEAAFLISDGVGEWASVSYGVYQNRELKIFKELRFPNSVGLLYSALSYYLGFSANGGEGKTMGLADYGKPEFYAQLLKTLDWLEDGSFNLRAEYWNFNSGLQPFTIRFLQEFGSPRNINEPLLQRHFDMAASLQKLTEELLLRIANQVYKETQLKNICLAGGSFLNVPTNSKVLSDTPFTQMFVQPAASDAGAALGAALYLDHRLDPKSQPKVTMTHAKFGPEYSDQEIEIQLQKFNLLFRRASEAELVKSVSAWITQGHAVAWFQGRMEFGPRALGARSILASARDPQMKDYLNSKIKMREAFRPYGISFLAELEPSMMLQSNLPGKKDFLGPFMLKLGRLNTQISTAYPSATHVDGSSRFQTVTPEDGAFYSLLKNLHSEYQMPLIINTSFNLDGEPIVMSPEDACKTWLKSKMTKMCIGGFLVEKNSE